jgi:hypothetical protein
VWTHGLTVKPDLYPNLTKSTTYRRFDLPEYSIERGQRLGVGGVRRLCSGIHDELAETTICRPAATIHLGAYGLVLTRELRRFEVKLLLIRVRNAVSISIALAAKFGREVA